MAVRWIQMNPQLHFRPIGFLDRDLMNKGRHIHGIEILGGYVYVESIVEQEEVRTDLIITENDLDTLCHFTCNYSPSVAAMGVG
jgi:FlaA1/EpsC-like NDP-sugar epimerase